MNKLKPYKINCPSIKTGTIYSFITESGENYEVRFGRKENNILHTSIIFGVTNDEYEGEEYSLTNKGEVYRVMKTIVEIVKIYRKEHLNVSCFEYTGEQSKKEKEKNKNIRLALYEKYIKEVFNNDWTVEKKDNKVIISKI